ncbi:MAG: hypothetical protein LC623_01255 [Halobacteriales archaeon]|nr:hypothetical protein [Halobacteriales archaeon]
MAAPSRLLAGIVLFALLAGCAQKSGDSTGPGGQAVEGQRAGDPVRVWAAHPQVTLAAGQEPVLARFAYAGPLNITKVISGTFAPQQVCPLGICAVEEQLASIDLSDSLPLGMPLHVTALLGVPSLINPPYLMVAAPPEDRLDEAENQVSAEGTRAAFSLQRNVDGPVSLTVVRTEAGQDASFAYTLTLHVDVLATLFDGRTPVAVQVPPGATALAVEEATPGGDVRLWDGKDAYLGNRSLSKGFVLLPVQPGEHVLQFSGATAALHVYVLAANGTAPPLLRALGFSRTLGELHDATGGTPVAWTFQPDAVPLGVGIRMASNPATLLMADAGADFQLRGPSGLLLGRIQVNSCLCSLQLAAGAWGTEATAGTYSASYTSTGTVQAQISHFVDHYVR